MDPPLSSYSLRIGPRAIDSPTCLLFRTTLAQRQLAPPPEVRLDGFAPPSLGLVSASAMIGFFLCQSSIRGLHPPPTLPLSALSLGLSTVKTHLLFPDAQKKIPRGNRGDTTPAPPARTARLARPARPLTRLTSCRSGPPLVSLLPRGGSAENSIRAALYGPGGPLWFGADGACGSWYLGDFDFKWFFSKSLLNA